MKNVGLFISEMNSGGAERVVSRLSKILENDYTIYIILFEDTYMEYECGGKIINMNLPAGGGLLKKATLLLKRVKALKKIKKDYSLDCVISFLDSPNIVNILSGGSCKKAVSIRNYTKKENSQSILGRLTDIFIKKLYQKADLIVPVSKVIAKSYKTDYAVPEEKLKVIYNPYDAGEIHERMSEPVDKETESFCSGKTVFVSVGRIMHQKGFWHLIKAFSEVRKSDENARLLIIGENRIGKEPQALVDSLGISDSVMFTGKVKNPFKYLAKSSVYVLSSLFEGFPNGMTEAMVCGLPIIATDCKSGPREILNKTPDFGREYTDVTECDFGILVPELEDDENWNAAPLTDGEKTLAKAMALLSGDEAKRADFAAKALKRGADFNYEACKKAYASIIDG